MIKRYPLRINPDPVKMTEAYSLVRQLLADGPRGFQDLLKAGIAAVPSVGASASGSGSGAEGSTSAVASSSGTAGSSVIQGKGKNRDRSVGKGRKGEVGPAVGVNIVPPGHPFVSANFLKNQILAVLTSQDLIRKRVTPADGKVQKHQFHLNLENPTLPPSLSTSIPTWDTHAHWSRILSGERPSALAHEYAKYKSSISSVKRDSRFDTGKVLRSERDVWAWSGRQEGLTTVLERDHLNVRRARARPGKERQRLGMNDALDRVERETSEAA